MPTPLGLKVLGGKTQVLGVQRSGNSEYWQRVKALFGSSLIGYWPLWETSGTAAVDQSGNGRDGVYRNDAAVPPALVGVALANAISARGKPVPLFSTGYVNAFSTSLRDAFNGGEWSIIPTMRVAAAGTWTDGTGRFLINLISATAGNAAYIAKSSTNNRMAFSYQAGGAAAKVINVDALNSTDFLYPAFTCSKTNDRLRAYINGAQQGADVTGLSAWAGELATAVIGASGLAATNPFSGWEGDVILLNREATAAEITKCYTGNF